MQYQKRHVPHQFHQLVIHQTIIRLNVKRRKVNRKNAVCADQNQMYVRRHLHHRKIVIPCQRIVQ